MAGNLYSAPCPELSVSFPLAILGGVLQKAAAAPVGLQQPLMGCSYVPGALNRSLRPPFNIRGGIEREWPSLSRSESCHK